MRKYLTLLIINTILLSNLNAQKIFKQQLRLAEPAQLIMSNYTAIKFCNDLGPQKFDINNPYTNLQLLIDEQEKVSHILYQTDFSGNISFVALSNNINERFNCDNTGLLRFCSCIKKIDAHIFDSEKSEGMIDCILSQLNLCNE